MRSYAALYVREQVQAEGYVEVLRDLLLAFTLPVFSRRVRRRMTTHPTLYLMDAGLFHSLRPTGPLDRRAELAGPALRGWLPSTCAPGSLIRPATTT